MPIPSLAEFQTRTKNTNYFESARGSNIKEIDSRLKAWEKGQHLADLERKRALLADLISACSKWLKKKRETTKTFTVARRVQISALANAALDELQSLGLGDAAAAFDRRKIHTLSQNPTRRGEALKGSYLHERTIYLKSGKRSAPSATLLHKYVNQSEYEGFQQFHGFFHKEFEQLTEKDFTALATLAAKSDLPSDVEYLRKQERLQHWIVTTSKGLFEYKVGGGLVTTSASYIWTMDEYGNMFCMEAQTIRQRNHSSFNAGKNVICGGGIKIKAGQLEFIDNTSGHYRPDRHALHTALMILNDDGADLSKTVVTVYEAKPDGSGMISHKYRSAETFLENENAVPDESF